MDVAEVAELLAQVRRSSPLVQCITNYVAMDLAANAVLAVGASPAMVADPAESGEFAAIASALTVNTGTPSPRWADGMVRATTAAVEAGRPWVLDPVAVGATAMRDELCAELMARTPSIVRANASEVLALARVTGASSTAEAGGGARGVDSTDSVESALDAAQALARRHSCVVAVTGEVDVVTDGTRVATVTGGHPLMARITATGCSLTAVTGAFAAVAPAFEAAVAACAVYAAAGSRAGCDAAGPGTLRWRLLDELHRLDESALRDGAQVVSS
ncbi:hydroxyethylthiazole kinase [Motilibacter peucedani]|uniref:Hydroxyethylthiazole kinase n=1 Tax=Motilibacter peucedani TaxID=598650 RepID=A0A420XL62_9ACTN|nr:hydroxyethylthiazole kinase [Motilibacter peucedani]RKS71274.1 hydroxyethylthiazole kinase [Motilibacter peucedani]